MTGPCMCGDPYCPNCGDPGLELIEEAENKVIEAFYQAKLTPDEYKIILDVGLAAVKAHRAAMQDIITNETMAAFEQIAYLEDKLSEKEQSNGSTMVVDGGPAL